MRNILMNPITAEEVFGTLEKIEYNPERIGDLTGMIKQELIEFFQDPENMEKILERLKV